MSSDHFEKWANDLADHIAKKEAAKAERKIEKRESDADWFNRSLNQLIRDLAAQHDVGKGLGAYQGTLERFGIPTEAESKRLNAELRAKFAAQQAIFEQLCANLSRKYEAVDFDDFDACYWKPGRDDE